MASDWSEILVGGPQSSVLSPFLFSTFINKVTKIISSHYHLQTDGWQAGTLQAHVTHVTFCSVSDSWLHVQWGQAGTLQAHVTHVTFCSVSDSWLHVQWGRLARCRLTSLTSRSAVSATRGFMCNGVGADSVLTVGAWGVTPPPVDQQLLKNFFRKSC
ncbi:hypothetical protein ACJJTC_018030 [Scirpophaga incertulas]